ncbi:hypothetical protein [Pontibacter sp. H249]|uniref:hypothetical protein n=1 Tax=Pontibacter sp. H249 TaxID=3133420 RepID=UPI0030BD9B44
MVNYEKLSKSTRTRTAILLLMLYMALAMADLLISFFGGILLGVLLMQFELEAQRFYKRSLSNRSSKTGLFRRYKKLSGDQKILLKAGLQVITTILLLVGIIGNFWGGIISGVLLATIANDIIRNRRKRQHKKEKAAKLNQKAT